MIAISRTKNSWWILNSILSSCCVAFHAQWIWLTIEIVQVANWYFCYFTIHANALPAIRTNALVRLTACDFILRHPFLASDASWHDD